MTQHLLSHFFVIGSCDICMRYCEECKACECVIRADEMLALENAAVADSWYEYE